MGHHHNLTQRTDHSGPKNLELGRGVKKWSPKRSHQTRWVFALDSELPYEEYRRGGNSILSKSMPPPSQKAWASLHRQLIMSSSQWISTGRMTRTLRIVQKQMELRRELVEEQKKERQQRWSKVAYPQNGGTARWNGDGRWQDSPVRKSEAHNFH